MISDDQRTRGAIVVVGGTAGLGLGVARHYVQHGRHVVVTGRDVERAKAVAAELGPLTQIATVDLARPHEIATGLADVGPVDHVVLAAIDRGSNTVINYDIDDAVRLVTLKLVGYIEAIRALLSRIDHEHGSILLFGGQAKDRPYPGSTMVSTVNGGIVGMMKTLAVELKPLRVNAIHPGIVGDSPFWAGKDEAVARVVAQTPTGRTVTMADIVNASVFLLENRSANAISLTVDGGRLLT